LVARPVKGNFKDNKKNMKIGNEHNDEKRTANIPFLRGEKSLVEVVKEQGFYHAYLFFFTYLWR